MWTRDNVSTQLINLIVVLQRLMLSQQWLSNCKRRWGGSGSREGLDRHEMWALRSGLRLCCNNRKWLNSALSQSQVSTVHTFYSQRRHREWRRKGKSHTSVTILPQRSSENDPHRLHLLNIQTKKKWHYSFRMIIYTIYKWYRRKVFVLFPYYCTAWRP